MKRLLLSQEDEWWGYFWTPDRPDDRHPGALRYNPETGLKLSLFAGFSDAEWRPNPTGRGQRLSQRTRVWGIVHGISDGHPITLLECREVRAKRIMAERIAAQDIIAQQGLFGIHLNDESESSFAGIDIEVEHLNFWAPESDTEIVIEMDEKEPRDSRWRVAVEPAAPRFADVDGMTAELSRWYQLPKFDPTRSRSSFSGHGTAHIKFSSPETRSVEEWQEVVHSFQDLVSLSVDAPCGLLVQNLLQPAAANTEDGSPKYKSIPLLTNEIVRGNPDDRPVQDHEALFTLRDIDLETLLPRWFAVGKRFRATVNMLVGAMYIDHAFLETQVVTAVAAAEAMHRKLEIPPPLPDDEFAERRASLMRILPNDQRSWLNKYLSRNEHTLKERLLELASRPDPSVMQKLLPNPNAWAKAAKDARNGIAHEGETAGEVDALPAIIRTTLAVIRMNLLHELGVPTERVLKAVWDNPGMRTTRRLAQEAWPPIPS